jgi:hypothetical protein
MAASTNATRVIVGTVWTSRTLLAREMRAAKEAEKADGIKRVFIYPADVVGKIVPPYARFVQGEVKKLGRNHPIIKTQFYCEEIDAQTGMFNAARRALMTGDQPSQSEPTPGHIYVFCIDIAGQDEAAMGTGDETTQLNNPGRDSVTLTIHDVDLSTLELLQAPTYRVVHREAWQGQNHLIIFGKLKNYADLWNPLYQVIDATGVGEGLWAMLDRTYPHRILPFKFTSTSKSELGYQYIGIIETGRFRDCAPSSEIDEQYSRCIAEVLIGPAKTMRWGVPAGTRDADGQLVHDDFIISDALISIVDKLDWYIPSETKVIESTDPLQEMDNAY